MDKNNNFPIAILLSTYNGEQYITEQLDSIINQTHKDWLLYIRDDGSNDRTIDIINDYEKKDHRIKILTDEVSHRGVKNSFLWLLQEIEADYYMFSDQDDVWEPEKINISYHKLKNTYENIPAVVCTDLMLVNQNLEVINKSMWETHHLTKLVDYKEGLIIASMFPGCSMMFNKAARTVALSENYKFPLHDMQISLSTYKNNGYIIPIHKPLIKYRQHSNNVVGLYSGQNYFVNKLNNLKATYKQIKEYYDLVHQYLSVAKVKFVKLKVLHLLHYI